jgi:hypothetical protein
MDGIDPRSFCVEIIKLPESAISERDEISG